MDFCPPGTGDLFFFHLPSQLSVYSGPCRLELTWKGFFRAFGSWQPPGQDKRQDQQLNDWAGCKQREMVSKEDCPGSGIPLEHIRQFHVLPRPGTTFPKLCRSWKPGLPHSLWDSRGVCVLFASQQAAPATKGMRIQSLCQSGKLRMGTGSGWGWFNPRAGEIWDEKICGSSGQAGKMGSLQERRERNCEASGET